VVGGLGGGYLRWVADTILFDIDGTLVDTNYHHALAWFRAFREYDVTVPVWRIHRAIGMGGDRLVGAVAGDEVEARHGDDVRAAWKRAFGPMLDEVVAFEGAQEVLKECRRLGLQVVLASSGAREHVEHYVDLLDFDAIGQRWISGDTASTTKPDPELLEIALEGCDDGRAVLIGDSVWDCEAAARIDLPCVTLRTGGFSADELLSAGAERVLDSPVELQVALTDLPRAEVKLNR
jgi:HAD superfamily hydrolase (TIGR01549 family)